MPLVNNHYSFSIYRQRQNVNFATNNSHQAWKAFGSPIEESKAAAQFRGFALVPETSTKLPASAGQLFNPSNILPGNHIAVPSSTVEVNAQQTTGAPKDLTPLHASRADILSSAGTYGDFSRYLQLFPGVVFNNDESDDLIVRGGNPIENLYLVDGIEIPNINHISTESSTGGLVSMIDTSAIQNVELRTGGYDSSYPERLSSVVSINTKQLTADRTQREAEIGIVGAGGLIETASPRRGSLLFSAHRSLLNLFTDDIGLNGVPVYTNTLLKAEQSVSNTDKITLLSLSGVDSINIQPCAGDIAETNTIQTQYAGWRSTNGARWQHLYSASSFGTFTLSDSEQHQNIHQQDQLLNNKQQKVNVYTCKQSPASSVSTPVYQEVTGDGQTSLKYDFFAQLNARTNLKIGAVARLMRFDYNVAQALGAQSPLSADPPRSDSTVFAPRFSSGETGFYAEGVIQPTKQLTASAGGRIQTFALTGSSTITPRLGINYQASRHTGIYAAFGDYAQLVPPIYIFAFPQNRFLRPMHARHIVAGIDLWRNQWLKIKLEAYRKDYRSYPVSTEYPSLSLANMVDTLGQEFIWLPLASRGTGRAEGIELSAESRLGNHIYGQMNVACARDMFAGVDGVLRPGNFDYPLVANFAATYRSGEHYEASVRYEYSSGRPYTPFLMTESLAQNRPIYDTNKINALRGPMYSRLDFQIDRAFTLRRRQIVVYAGLENATDRKNFLAYEWMPRCEAAASCVKHYDYNLATPVYQISRFPNFGIQYMF